MQVFNPIKFSNDVNTKFLNYQLTAFPLADPDLADQAKKLLKGGVDFQPLIKGPYISISRSFKWGRNLKEMADQGLVHPALPGLSEHSQMFAHQDKALQAIKNGNHCLISTGTGSGKTESFLYPIFDYCLKLRDEKAPEGIVAILVYPMNALAMDQLNRLRNMLAGSGISFGLYIGSTPANMKDVKNNYRMNEGEGKARYEELKKENKSGENFIISPSEERLTEEDIASKPPRILLTNVKQLELLMTRTKDIRIFLDAPLKYLVFDEAHTYSGITGSEVSCLIRRLRNLTGKNADEVICVGTSATIVDPELGEEAGKIFAQRFFGIEAEKISLIQEEYEIEEFQSERYNPVLPKTDMTTLLENILLAIEVKDEAGIKENYEMLTGRSLTEEGSIYEEIFESLKYNNYIYFLFHFLGNAKYVSEAIQGILAALGRKDRSSSEENRAEMLSYLALGAAAQKNGNPLLRPKLHYFVKGLEGAVAAFEKEQGKDSCTRIFLSKQSAAEKYDYSEKAFLPLFVCRVCGQHYFESFFKNAGFDGDVFSGGQAEGNNSYWLPADDISGSRVILTDRFVSEIDDDEGIITERLEKVRDEIYFCRCCGTLQKHKEDKCANPNCKKVNTLAKLFILKKVENEILTSCPSCRSRSKNYGRNIEPIRPLRAVTVSDVHILTQNMINAAKEDNQKLIVFTDNRQDAAFQAGWMLDHARRYRFIHLIYEYLNSAGKIVAAGDIQSHLYQLFTKDRSLGVMLAPEVYDFFTDESYGSTFSQQLKYYLRIQIIRELCTAFSHKEGLEPWGILKISYDKLDAENSFVKKWAERTGIKPDELASGIMSLVDIYRRGKYFYDEYAGIYSKMWNEGDFEIQQGYFPLIMGSNNNSVPPKGIVERDVQEIPSTFRTNFRSTRGQTLTVNYVSKWFEDSGQKDEFLDELWVFLTKTIKVLKPVALRGSQERIIANNVYQVDSSKVGLSVQWKFYQCNVCHRIHARYSPGGACTAMHCKGVLSEKQPSSDNYNISLLSNSFSMIKPQEHTAQVPARVREKVEEEFKKKSGRFNTLVASPTLELGVDIGALDMVLMRNMPPTPSNYWQRAGRAGRRHRLAVVYSYARRSDHDQYYFNDPQLMLGGAINTPKFNMRNEVMIRKHIHASVLSELLRINLAENSFENISEEDVAEIKDLIPVIFPGFIGSYLFNEDGEYNLQPVDVSGLSDILRKHRQHFDNVIPHIFSQYWPKEDSGIVTEEQLSKFIQQSGTNLQEVINLLHLRMMWAVNTQQKYINFQKQRLLTTEEERILQRCRAFLKGLNEHNQQNYTLNVLANEGYLPGYGLYDSGIKAYAHQSFIGGGRKKPDFDLSRPAPLAIREYIPGNLIYANNGRFKVVLYRLQSINERVKSRQFKVNLEKHSMTQISDTGNGNAEYTNNNIQITGIPISDCDIHYVSRISDEEANRFQMPVVIMGRLKGSRRGGRSYTVNDKNIQLLFGQGIILLNIGAKEFINSQAANQQVQILGYPICTVCGAARAPMSSKAELEHFRDFHKDRCGKIPENIGLFAEDNVDGILITKLEDEKAAANLGESVVIGAAQILEMERNDLSVLTFRESDDTYSLFIYDPMPGGSGLLNQILESWKKIIEAALTALEECPNKCETSCYSCLRTYYNVFNHSFLDRHYAKTLLDQFNNNLNFEFELGPEEEIKAANKGNNGTNNGETALFDILCENGFPAFETQKAIEIGPPYKRTIPDLYYEDDVLNIKLAIYLDGLSRQIHGNEEKRRVDIIIRSILEEMGIDVIEIAASDLNDPVVLKLHLKKIAGKLKRQDIKERFKTNS